MHYRSNAREHEIVNMEYMGSMNTVRFAHKCDVTWWILYHSSTVCLSCLVFWRSSVHLLWIEHVRNKKWGSIPVCPVGKIELKEGFNVYTLPFHRTPIVVRVYKRFGIKEFEYSRTLFILHSSCLITSAELESCFMENRSFSSVNFCLCKLKLTRSNTACIITRKKCCFQKYILLNRLNVELDV